MKKKIAWILESGEEPNIGRYEKMLNNYHVCFFTQPFYLHPMDLDQPGEYDLLIISAEYENDFSEFLDFIDHINEHQTEVKSSTPMLVPLMTLDFELHGSEVEKRCAKTTYKPFNSEMIKEAVEALI